MDDIVEGPVGTMYRVIDGTLLIDLQERHTVVSSAPQGGGVRIASYILNHQVDNHPPSQDGRPHRFGDPARCLKALAASYGLQGETVGLMTAVPMTQLVTSRYVAGPLWVECFATVGITNAIRAGEWGTSQCAQPLQRALANPGTINLIIITNGRLATAAMVGAVQVATEAKTAVLMGAEVPCMLSGFPATGTGTDAVVIACRRKADGMFYRYSGTHTILGVLIARAVTTCVSAGLRKATRWKDTRHKR